MNIERIGTRQYAGTNERGASIEIGKGPGQWSPGELLQLALLGCNAMSSDARLASLLGDDFSLEGSIVADYNEAEERYVRFGVKLVPDFEDANQDDVAKTTRRALAAIERQCTIGRTLDHVVPHTTSIEVE